MHYKEWFIGLAVGILAATLIFTILSPSIGEFNTFLIILSSALLLLAYSIGMAWRSNRRLIKSSRLRSCPFPDEVTEAAQDVEDTLLALGFKPFGGIEVSNANLPEPVLLRIYTNKAHNIMANIPVFSDGYVNFSTSYPDGYDVSTNYPYGEVRQTRKTISQTVDSSLETALDYHLHHSTQHIAEHGQPLSFESTVQLTEWEIQQNYMEDAVNANIRSSLQLNARLYFSIFILTPFFTALILLVLAIFDMFIDTIRLPFVPTMNIVGLIVLIVVGTWAIRPPQASEPVDVRKKHDAAT